MVECPGFACVAWKVVDAHDETFPAMLAADIVRYHGGKIALHCVAFLFVTARTPRPLSRLTPRRATALRGELGFAGWLGSQPLHRSP